jgi:hypothetical protein
MPTPTLSLRLLLSMLAENTATAAFEEDCTGASSGEPMLPSPPPFLANCKIRPSREG